MHFNLFVSSITLMALSAVQATAPSYSPAPAPAPATGIFGLIESCTCPDGSQSFAVSATKHCYCGQEAATLSGCLHQKNDHWPLDRENPNIGLKECLNLRKIPDAFKACINTKVRLAGRTAGLELKECIASMPYTTTTTTTTPAPAPTSNSPGLFGLIESCTCPDGSQSFAVSATKHCYCGQEAATLSGCLHQKNDHWPLDRENPNIGLKECLNLRKIPDAFKACINTKVRLAGRTAGLELKECIASMPYTTTTATYAPAPTSNSPGPFGLIEACTCPDGSQSFAVSATKHCYCGQEAATLSECLHQKNDHWPLDRENPNIGLKECLNLRKIPLAFKACVNTKIRLAGRTAGQELKECLATMSYTTTTMTTTTNAPAPAYTTTTTQATYGSSTEVSPIIVPAAYTTTSTTVAPVSVDPTVAPSPVIPSYAPAYSASAISPESVVPAYSAASVSPEGTAVPYTPISPEYNGTVTSSTDVLPTSAIGVSSATELSVGALLSISFLFMVL